MRILDEITGLKTGLSPHLCPETYHLYKIQDLQGVVRAPPPSICSPERRQERHKEGRQRRALLGEASETVPRGNYALVKVAGMLELVFKFLCNQKHPVYGSHKPIMLSIRKDYILKKVPAVRCCAYLSSEHLRKPRPAKATRVKPCLKVPKPKQNQTPQNMPKTILT